MSVQQYEPPVKVRESMRTLTPDQAKSQIDSSSSLVTYEAKWALQQVKDYDLPTEELLNIVEPIARCIGWAEGLSFALHQMRQDQVVPTNGGISR